MEKSSDQPSFIRSLIKSKTENQQLDFWRSVSIAYICSKTSFPENDMIKFRNFHNKGDSWYLVFSVDGRSKLYNDIQKSNHVELCWFFALSREKYRIKSTLKGYSTDSFAAEPSADSALTFEQFKNLWENEINKEEKKLFTEAAPSTKTSDKLNKQIDDINNYNTPDIGGISTNFALLLAEVSEGYYNYLCHYLLVS